MSKTPLEAAPPADDGLESGRTTAVQREQEWLRDLVGAPRLPLLGCSIVAHDRLGFCATCVRPLLDGWPDGDRAELLGWQLLALRQDEVAASEQRDLPSPAALSRSAEQGGQP